jgi:hypothetical protein
MTAATFTTKTAAMSLATAKHILTTPEEGWTLSQVQRARVVAAKWLAIRKAQSSKAAA